MQSPTRKIRKGGIDKTVINNKSAVYLFSVPMQQQNHFPPEKVRIENVTQPESELNKLWV
jgi:hypothetical protein